MVLLYKLLILGVELLLGSIVLFGALLSSAGVDTLDLVEEPLDFELAELHQI